MADNRKKYTKQELENLSIEELRRIDKGISTPSPKQPIKPKPTRPKPTRPKPTRPKPLPTQDCSEERQMLQEVSQLSSPEAMISRLEDYTLNNKPCINIPIPPPSIQTTESCDSDICGDVNGDGSLNVLDVVMSVNQILDEGFYSDIDCLINADYNRDGYLNVLDIVQTVNQILQGGVVHECGGVSSESCYILGDVDGDGVVTGTCCEDGDVDGNPVPSCMSNPSNPNCDGGPAGDASLVIMGLVGNISGVDDWLNQVGPDWDLSLADDDWTPTAAAYNQFLAGNVDGDIGWGSVDATRIQQWVNGYNPPPCNNGACAGYTIGDPICCYSGQYDECGICDGDNLYPDGCSCNIGPLDECGICGGPDECPCGDGTDHCECCEPSDSDDDGIHDFVDDCVGEYDECGVCNGSGYLQCLGDTYWMCLSTGQYFPDSMHSACDNICPDSEMCVTECEGEGVGSSCGGIANGCVLACDCDGNVTTDYWCDEDGDGSGCGIPTQFCGAAVGLCSGNAWVTNNDDEYCDCTANYYDCAGECGGTAIQDECGVCGGDGSLCENEYTDETFHDFSQVGYNYGVLIPEITGCDETVPIDEGFPEIPDDGELSVYPTATTFNDYISDLSNNGGGVLCLPEGEYIMWSDFILKSNVILRGHPDGTYIWFINGGTIKTENDVIGQGSFIDINGLVERGSNIILLDNTTGLGIGDDIGIYVNITNDFVSEYGMEGFWGGTEAELRACGHEHEDGCYPGIEGWHPFYRRKIENISGNTIIIDVPVRMDINTTILDEDGNEVDYLPAQVQKITGYKENIGIEDLFVSNVHIYYDDAWEEDPGVSVIHLDGVKNSWIKNVRSFTLEDVAPSWHIIGLISGNVNTTIMPTDYPEIGHLTNLVENYIDYIPECHPPPCVDMTWEHTHTNIGQHNDNYPNPADDAWHGQYGYDDSHPQPWVWQYHTCDWYAINHTNPGGDNATSECPDQGDNLTRCDCWGDEAWEVTEGGSGFSANEACCICGGGGCNIKDSWKHLFGDILGIAISEVEEYQNVSAEHRHLASHGIKITDSKLVTVKDCYMALPQNRGEGGNGYLYTIGSSNEILVEGSEGYRGRHNFSVSTYNSGIVFSRFYSSGGWNMSADGIDGRDVDWYSRYQGLEVLGLGVTGKCDTHQQLNHAILVTDSDILDAVSSENRRYLSRGAGHTSLDTVLWNIRGPGENGNDSHTGWETMSVPGMGLVTSFSADQGYVVDAGTSLNIFTEAATAFEIAEWASEQMAQPVGLLPASNLDIGDNSLTLLSSILSQFATSAFQHIDDEIANTTGLEEGTCNGEWLGIPWESPNFNPGTIALNFNLDDWFADPIQSLIGTVQLNNPDMSLRLGIYSESALCTALPCVVGGSGESNWTGNCISNHGDSWSCGCGSDSPWNACSCYQDVYSNTCEYHDFPVLPDDWESLDPYLEIWGEFSTITIDFEVTGMEPGGTPSVTTNISTTGSNLGYEPDGNWPTWCELADTLFNIMDWTSGNLLSGMIVDILLLKKIQPKIDEKILELLSIEGNLLTKLHRLHTFTGEENTQPDDIVTTSADVGYSGVNNLYEYQRDGG